MTSYGTSKLSALICDGTRLFGTSCEARIERGFIGSHADIGGGFAANEKQLSQVALAWMVQQAKDAGVTMNDPRYDLPATAVFHDKSDSIRTGAPKRPLTAMAAS